MGNLMLDAIAVGRMTALSAAYALGVVFGLCSFRANGRNSGVEVAPQGDMTGGQAPPDRGASMDEPAAKP